MNDHIVNVNGLVLSVQVSGDVGKLEKFFGVEKDGHNRFSKIVGHLLDNLFALKYYVRHQLPVVVL